jgi:hypothetical protein
MRMQIASSTSSGEARQHQAREDLLLDLRQRDEAAHQDDRHQDVGGDVVLGKPGDGALHGAFR